jgi:hypothetical protein
MLEVNLKQAENLDSTLEATHKDKEDLLKSVNSRLKI